MSDNIAVMLLINDVEHKLNRFLRALFARAIYDLVQQLGHNRYCPGRKVNIERWDIMEKNIY